MTCLYVRGSCVFGHPVVHVLPYSKLSPHEIVQGHFALAGRRPIMFGAGKRCDWAVCTDGPVGVTVFTSLPGSDGLIRVSEGIGAGQKTKS